MNDIQGYQNGPIETGASRAKEMSPRAYNLVMSALIFLGFCAMGAGAYFTSTMSFARMMMSGAAHHHARKRHGARKVSTGAHGAKAQKDQGRHDKVVRARRHLLGTACAGFDGAVLIALDIVHTSSFQKVP